MAPDDPANGLTDALNLAASAIPLLSALEVIVSQGNSASEALHTATRHSAHAATVELAATANSAMLILGGQPARNSKKVKKILRALKRWLDQNPGAPVVT